MREEVSQFIQRADLPFEKDDVLETALTHSSWAYEHAPERRADNERLEFLGDAVLQLSVSTALFSLSPSMAEGRMSKMRSLLVCEETLARLARKLDLGAVLLLGHGEEITGGREKDSNLANAMEAVMGALFLEKGFDVASSWVLRELQPYLELVLQGQLRYDYKSALLEFAQTLSTRPQVHFEIVSEEGPVHDRTFTTEVKFDERPLGRGSGRSKKEAEQKASRFVLEQLSGTRES